MAKVTQAFVQLLVLNAAEDNPISLAATGNVIEKKAYLHL
jgi:hypothetical protein